MTTLPKAMKVRFQNTETLEASANLCRRLSSPAKPAVRLTSTRYGNMRRPSAMVSRISGGGAACPVSTRPSMAAFAAKPLPGGVRRPTTSTPAMTPIRRMPSATRIVSSTVSVPRNFAAVSFMAASPSFASTSARVGRNAAVIVPSAVKRRSRLGRRKATA